MEYHLSNYDSYTTHEVALCTVVQHAIHMSTHVILASISNNPSYPKDKILPREPG